MVLSLALACADADDSGGAPADSPTVRASQMEVVCPANERNTYAIELPMVVPILYSLVSVTEDGVVVPIPIESMPLGGTVTVECSPESPDRYVFSVLTAE